MRESLGKKITPNVNSNDPVSFWELGEYDFEEICCAIVHEQPGVAKADFYGVRGETQFGIDILAPLEGGGYLCVQCKCYEKFPPKEIRNAADNFLAHWESKWKAAGVRRFILMVACDISSRLRQDAVIECRAKFAEIGVEFDDWGNRPLERRLAPHHHIVSRFFQPKEHFLEIICGVSLTPYIVSPSGDIIPAQHYIDATSESANAKLEEVRSLHRSGKPDSAYSRYSEIRSSGDEWRSLARDTQAQFLRLAAEICLSRSDDVNAARELAIEADQLHPLESIAIIHVVLDWRENGPDSALESLANTQTTGGLLLKTAILASLDRFQDSSDCLNLVVPASETEEGEKHRLEATIQFAEGNIIGAIQSIKLGAICLPASDVILASQASILYYSAISPSSRPRHIPVWPSPRNWSMVRTDQGARENLLAASEIFGNLIDKCEIGEQQLQNWQGWKLACLSNLIGRSDEARDYCEELLRKRSSHTPALGWALSRNLASRGILERSRTELEELVDGKLADANQIVSLCAIHMDQHHSNQAIKTLKKTRDVFVSEGLEHLWMFWMGQCVPIEGWDSEIRKFAEQEPRLSMHQLARDPDEMEGMREFTTQALEDNRLEDFSDGCQFLSQNEDWEFVAQYSQQLAIHVATSWAIQTGAEALFHLGNSDGCRDFLEEHRSVFPHRELPHSMQRMMAQLDIQAGNIAGAIRRATEVSSQSGHMLDKLSLANMHIHAGDIHKAANVVHDLPEDDVLPLEAATEFAKVFARERPEISENLLGKLLASPIDARIAGSLLFEQTRGLLTPEQTARLEISFFGAIESGDIPSQKLAGIEELLEFAKKQSENSREMDRLLRNGEIHTHEHASLSNRSIFEDYHVRIDRAVSSKNPMDDPVLFAQHGGRGIPNDFPDGLDGWDLILDLSSLLLAHHFNILPCVEENFRTLKLPPETARALTEMIAKVQEADERLWLERLRNRVTQGLMSGKYAYLPMHEGRPEDLNQNIENRCLHSWLSAPVSEETISWCDDRFINGHQVIRGMPVASLFDIANILYRQGKLQETEYYELLNRMRASNVRFIPIEANEILHHLFAAEVTDGEVVETPQLAVLRRYLGACMSSAGHLRNLNNDKPVGGGLEHEFQFCAQAISAVAEAISSCWSGVDDNLKASIAYSEWIVGALYTEHLPVEPNWAEGASDQLRVTFIPLLSLVGKIFLLVGTTDGEVARNYSNWLQGKLIGVRLRSTVGLLKMMTRFIKENMIMDPTDKDVLSGHLSDQPKEDQLNFIQNMNCQFVKLLPDELFQILLSDRSVRKSLGLNRDSAPISLGENEFSVQEWSSSLERAVCGMESTLSSRNGDEFSLDAEFDSGEGIVVVRFDPTKNSSSKPFELASSLNGVFLPTERERIDNVCASYREFDLSENECRKIFEGIAKFKTPSVRFRRGLQVLGDSYVVFESELAQSFERSQKFKTSVLHAPSVESLRRFLRIAGNGRLSEQVKLGARELIEAFDLETAIDRLTRLPIPLPEPIWQALDDLDNDALSSLLERWKARANSQLAMFHFLRVAHKYQYVGDEEVQSLLLDIVQDEKQSKLFQLFKSILTWSDSLPVKAVTKRTVSAESGMIYSWLHAETLFRTLCRFQIDLDWANNLFSQITKNIDFSRYVRSAQYGDDIVEPSCLSYETWLLKSASYSLTETDSSSITPDLSAAFRELCTLADGDQKYPCFALLADESCASNLLNSYLGASIGGCLQHVANGEWSEFVEPTNLRTGVLQELKNNERSFEQNFGLIAPLVAHGWAHKTLVQPVMNRLEVSNFDEALDGDEPFAALSLYNSAQVAVRNSNQSLRDKVLDLTCEAIDKTQFLSSTNVETLFVLSAFDDGEAMFAQALGENFTAVAKRAPAIAPKLVRCLVNVVPHLAPAASTEVWRAIAVLRASF